MTMKPGTSIDEEVVRRICELQSRGEPILQTHKSNPPNVIGFPTLDSGKFEGWRTQCLVYLEKVFGSDHTYTTSFAKATDQHGHQSEVKKGMAILDAAAEDVEHGYLATLRSLITGDVFVDLLDQAEHLLENGYKDPAAMLTGAVLENGLRSIATECGVKVKTGDDLSALNSKLAVKSAFSRLTQKKVAVWIDVRNKAAHGQFDEYREQDVEEMVKGVVSLLAEYIR